MSHSVLFCDLCLCWLRTVFVGKMLATLFLKLRSGKVASEKREVDRFYTELVYLCYEYRLPEDVDPLLFHTMACRETKAVRSRGRHLTRIISSFQKALLLEHL